MYHRLWLASCLLISCVPKSRTSAPSSLKLLGEWRSVCFASSKLNSSHLDQYVIENKNITWTKVGYKSPNCAGEKEYQYRILMSYHEQSESLTGLNPYKVDFTYGKSYFTPYSESGIEIGKDIDSSKAWEVDHEQEIENSNFKVGKVDYDIAAVSADSLCLGERDEAHDKTSVENRPELISKTCLTRAAQPQ